MTVTPVETITAEAAKRQSAPAQSPVYSDGPRPLFELSDITDMRHHILDSIEDLNADALSSVCEICGARMSWGQWLNASDLLSLTKCHRCDSLVDTGTCLDPSEALLAELREPGYFDRTWYHATMRRNWLSGARGTFGGEFLIHAGDRLTALARADSFYESRGISPKGERRLEVFIYSFRFQNSQSFRRELFDDMEMEWPEDRGHERPMRVIGNGDSSPAGDVTMYPSFPGAGYYNRYELPGTVSVIAPAKSIDLDTVEMISLEA